MCEKRTVQKRELGRLGRRGSFWNIFRVNMVFWRELVYFPFASKRSGLM